MSESGAGRGRAATRMAGIPEYHFAEVGRAIAARRASGEDVVSLDIGDPDQPTPATIVEAAEAALRDPANHHYQPYGGLPALREAMAAWYRRRFGVAVDADREVLPVLGTKDAIAHLPLALLDPGDVVLCPDPGYPVYVTAALLAGAEPVPLPLRAERGWVPDLGAVPESVLRRARLLWLNHPANPTGAVAPLSLFEDAVALCSRYGITLVHDAPYTEVAFDGYRAPSLLQVEGAREVGVELHSLSKTHAMTGWRVGMAVGNAEVLALLGRLKTQVDSGIFGVVQHAAIAALALPDAGLTARNAAFQARLRRLRVAFAAIGAIAAEPAATFYLWARVPDGGDSISWSRRLLDTAGINVTPGVRFGRGGEGWFRVSATVPDERITEACARLERLARGRRRGAAE